MCVLGTLFLFLALATPAGAPEAGWRGLETPQKTRHSTAASLPAQSTNAGSEDRNGLWLDVPFFPQQKNGCGASSLAMILQYWNSVPVADPQSIFSLLYSDKLKGIPASRMKAYLEEQHFRAFTFTGTFSDLKEHLLKGRPLIVSLGGSSLHYVVVVGLDERQNHVLLNDPAVKKLSRMDREDFLTAWKQTNYWTLLAVPDVRP